MRPRSPATRLTRAIKQRPRLHRTARAARALVGRFLPARRYPRIPGRVHPNDFMFDDPSPEGVSRYRARALNVIGHIESSLTAAGTSFDGPERWLDFGCGYGRVLRYLCERVPPQRVWVCDIEGQAVDFCRSQFGVHGTYATSDLERVALGTFDFVYAISVLSHLNERNSRAFVRLLGGALRPGGILLFTTHGRWSLEHPETYGEDYVRRQREIAEAVEAHGVCFLRYTFVEGDEYGMAWHSKDYVQALVQEYYGDELQLLLFEPHGLDGHQDVWTFRRRVQKGG
jgi:SAM-dependent methyltransferase